jgi:hypothetical protein
MRPSLVSFGVLVALVLTGVAVVFVVGGVPTLGDGADAGSSPAETPAFSDTSRDEATASKPDPTRTPGETTPPPFAFSIDAVEPCGWTCRDVTSTMTNQQGTPARDVTVFARISVGEAEGGDVVWEGTETVGTLEAGESYTVTRRVQLSYGEGFAVQQHGGWVTVRTTVRTADQTVTVTEQRQVA